MRQSVIRSAIESLVLCESCAHGVAWHDAGGCSDCRCSLTREAVIEVALASARDEIRHQWGAGGGSATA
jgi:hypothetical protein